MLGTDKERANNSPSVDNPDEGGVVLVAEVTRQGVLGEEITVEDPPAPAVRQPDDHGHQI